MEVLSREETGKYRIEKVKRKHLPLGDVQTLYFLLLLSRLL